MKNNLTIFILLLATIQANANPPNKTQITDDLNELITDITNNYIYLKDKAVDLACIKA